MEHIYNETSKYSLSNIIQNKNDDAYKDIVLPLIHIEAHGSNQGIQMIDRSFFSFDQFIQKITAINVASENNTFVLSHTCSGMAGFLQSFAKSIKNNLEKNHHAPMFAGLFAKEKISAGDIEDHIIEFYKNFLTGNDCIEVMKNYQQVVGMDRYYCEEHLRTTIKEYCKQFYPLTKKKQNEFLTLMMEDLSKKYPVSEIRKVIKDKEIIKKLLSNVLKKFKENFLINKDSDFDIDKLLKQHIKNK